MTAGDTERAKRIFMLYAVSVLVPQIAQHTEVRSRGKHIFKTLF